jgi:hypothetical protein
MDKNPGSNSSRRERCRDALYNATLEVAQRIAGHADSRTRSSMIVAVKRFYSKTWSEFATEYETYPTS